MPNGFWTIHDLEKQKTIFTSYAISMLFTVSITHYRFTTSHGFGGLQLGRGSDWHIKIKSNIHRALLSYYNNRYAWFVWSYWWFWNSFFQLIHAPLFTFKMHFPPKSYFLNWPARFHGFVSRFALSRHFIDQLAPITILCDTNLVTTALASITW